MNELRSKNSLEVLSIESESNSIQSLQTQQYQQQQQYSEKNYKQKDSNFYNLPGQLDSQDSQIDDMKTSSSSEFDYEIFNKQKSPVKKINVPPTQQNLQHQNVQFLKVMGIKFEIKILQQRNKNPLVFLKSVFFTITLIKILFFVTFTVGFKFKILPTILSTITNICGLIFTVNAAKKSPEEAHKMHLDTIPFQIIIGLNFIGLFIYSFFINFPFNSLPIFLFLIYIISIVACTNAGLILNPNLTPWDDPNYQLKFFTSRLMFGFFSGTGVLDVLSDMVLGIELIQQFSNFFLLFIGIFLVVLCLIDYFMLFRKIFLPSNFLLKEYFFQIFIEVIIIIQTSIVMYFTLKESDGEDTFFVTIISLTTTIINLLHNLFAVYNIICNSNSDEQIM